MSIPNTLVERKPAMSDTLRLLADWADQHPEASIEHVSWSIHATRQLDIIDTRPDDASQMAKIAKAIGGRWDKESKNGYYRLKQEVVPGVLYEIAVPQSWVCERVVVGQKTSTVTMPDPEAVAELPTFEQEVVEDIVEWRCPPSLLALDQADSEVA